MEQAISELTIPNNSSPANAFYTAERDAAISESICIIIGLLPKNFIKKLIIKLYATYIQLYNRLI